MIPAKPEPTAREVADAFVRSIGRHLVPTYQQSKAIILELTAVIEARDSHLREVHAREVAELRGRFDHLVELVRQWSSHGEMTTRAWDWLRDFDERRSLGGKVEP